MPHVIEIAQPHPRRGQPPLLLPWQKFLPHSHVNHKHNLGAPFIAAQGVRQSRHIQDLPQAGLAIAAGHNEDVVKAPRRAAAVL